MWKEPAENCLKPPVTVSGSPASKRSVRHCDTKFGLWNPLKDTAFAVRWGVFFAGNAKNLAYFMLWFYGRNLAPMHHS